MDIPLPPELMDPDLSNTSDGTGVATVASVGLYANGRYGTRAGTGSESQSAASTATTSDPAKSASPEHAADSTNQSGFSLSRASPTPSIPKDPDVAKPAELRKLWKPVRANPTDFTAWTVLLSFVEQQENIVFIREAYDAFFGRYPYCYGYWKKYSELEKRFGSSEQSETVLEQGITAIPLSIELWMYYIEFAKDKYKGVAGEGRIRQLFGRAIEAAGLDFKSDDLWDAYIQWEKSFRQTRNIFNIYERLLRIPTLHYLRHFEELQQLIQQNSMQDLISAEELQALRPLVPEGEDPELMLRQMVTESRKTLHKATEVEAGKRWTFETNIRRPYFHIKPLESSQIKNWHEYIDFEIEEKQSNRIIFLFERCLVACALYEEFWRKYIDYLKSNQLTDYVRYAYQRVCTYHLTNKTGLHLDWAAFEEEEGNMSGAIQALQNGLRHLPNKAIMSLRQIGILRRMQNDPLKIQTSFEGLIQGAEDAGLAEFFLIKQARYYLKVKKDKERAMELIRTGLKRDPTSNPLLIALVDCELQQMPLNMSAVVEVFDEVLAKDELTNDQKLDFLERKIHHLEDFSMDIREIRAAHRQYYEMTAHATRGRKRAYGEDEDETMESSLPKKPVEIPSSMPPMGPITTFAMASGVIPPPATSWPVHSAAVSTAAAGFPYTAAWPAGSYGQSWPAYQATST